MKSSIVDKDTFSAFQRGDESAFQVIMWGSYSLVKNFIQKIVKSDMDAEELTQDVFLKLWQNHGTVNSHDKFRSYLFSIAHNTAMSFMRKTAPVSVEIDERIISSEFAANLHDKFDAQQIMFIVSMTVAAMPAQRKAIFKMSRIEGLSIDEIAQRLNISRSTVKSHLNSALNRLREVLMLVIIILAYFSTK